MSPSSSSSSSSSLHFAPVSILVFLFLSAMASVLYSRSSSSLSSSSSPRVEEPLSRSVSQENVIPSMNQRIRMLDGRLQSLRQVVDSLEEPSWSSSPPGGISRSVFESITDAKATEDTNELSLDEREVDSMPRYTTMSMGNESRWDEQIRRLPIVPYPSFLAKRWDVDEDPSDSCRIRFPLSLFEETRSKSFQLLPRSPGQLHIQSAPGAIHFLASSSLQRNQECLSAFPWILSSGNSITTKTTKRLTDPKEIYAQLAESSPDHAFGFLRLHHLDSISDIVTAPVQHSSAKMGLDSAAVKVIDSSRVQHRSEGIKAYFAVLENALADSRGIVYDRLYRYVHLGCGMVERGKSEFNLAGKKIALVHSVVVLPTKWGEGYFHMVAESIFRLAQIWEFFIDDPNVYIYLERSKYKGREVELLQLYGIDSSRVLFANDVAVMARYVYMPNGIYCGLPTHPQLNRAVHILHHIHRGIIREKRNSWIQDAMKNSNVPLLAKDVRIVLITKRIRGARSLSNYDAVVKAIRSYPNWYLLEFTGSETLLETLCMFSAADFVIGPHGAGLIHTSFVRPGGAFLEISPSAYPNIRWNPCFFFVASWRSLKSFFYFPPSTNDGSSLSIPSGTLSFLLGEAHKYLQLRSVE